MFMKNAEAPHYTSPISDDLNVRFVENRIIIDRHRAIERECGAL